MAELYLCSALGPEGFAKDVVIKRVRPHLATDPVFVDMFVAEARLASRLNHRNIIHIFDFDRHEDTYYLAMEFVRGASLWELRRRCREKCVAIPPVLAAHIGAEVAHGLAYAHRLTDGGQPLNLVHRDVTPHNILLSFEGTVKLTDFGIARANNSVTAPGVLKGKYAYMSPEQARGEQVDSRTDLFALGVVLWEMLTGGRLFEGDSDLAILRAVQRSEIAPPARLNPDVPEALDAAVMRALQRDAGRRYQSATELARDLAQVVLQNARSFADTDVGAFLRRVVGEPDGDPVFTSKPPPKAKEVPVPARAGRSPEPTAVMPGRRAGRQLVQERTPTGEPAAHQVDDISSGSTVVLATPGPSGAQEQPDSSHPQAAEHATSPATPFATKIDESLSSRIVAPSRGLRAVHAIGGALVVLVVVAAGGALWSRSSEGANAAVSPQPEGSVHADAPSQSSATEGGPHLQIPSEAVAAGSRTDVQSAEGMSTTVTTPTAFPSGIPPGGTEGQGQSVATITPMPGTPSSASSQAQVPNASPSPGGPGIAIAPPADTAALHEAESLKPAAAKVKTATGTVVLDVFPFAQVTIDGIDFGQASGSRTLRLPVGGHRVVLRHSHRSKTYTVTVRAGRTTEIKFNAFKVE